MNSNKISGLIVGVIIFVLLGFFRQEDLFAQGAVQGQAQSAGQQQAGSGSVQPPAKAEEVKKALTPAVSVLEIKRLESENPLYSIELREVLLTDLFRVIAHDYNLNILMDQNVSGTITASFTNISLEEALDAIAELSNLSIEKKGNIVKISPNLLTKTLVLKYIEAKKLLDASTPSPSPTGLYGLLSANGKILLGQQQNSLTVIDSPDKVKRVAEYLQVIDHKLESRVFKLKYLKADEVVGVTVKTTTTTQTIAPTGTEVSTTTSSSSSSGTTSK